MNVKKRIFHAKPLLYFLCLSFAVPHSLVLAQDPPAAGKDDGAKNESPTLEDQPANPLDIIGVDPATLTPTGIDLSSLLPSVKATHELTLKPTLSYSEDRLDQKLGLTNPAHLWDIQPNAPKRWQFHLGELVRLVPRKPRGEAYTSQGHIYHTAEIQTYFINAQGQEVSFYPDPENPCTDLDPNNDAGCNPPNINGMLDADLTLSDLKPKHTVWYSDSGNYKLIDDPAEYGKYANVPANPNPYGNGYFVLKTPGGLSLVFEVYEKYHATQAKSLDGKPLNTGLALRYRVKSIHDRFGNAISVNHETGKNLPLSISANEKTISFTYESYGNEGRKRLSTVAIPGYNAVNQTYRFYYPDQKTYVGTNDQRLRWANEAAFASSLFDTGTPTSGDEKILIDSFTTGGRFDTEFVENIGSGEPVGYLYFDLDSILDEVEDKATDFLFRVKNPNNNTYAFFKAVRPIETRGEFLNPNKMELSPDRVMVDFLANISIPTSALGDPITGGIEGNNAYKARLDVFPLPEQGDWVINSADPGERIEIDVTNLTWLNEALYLQGTYTFTVGSNTPLYMLRSEGLGRIQEIVFPTGQGTAKHLMIEYGDATSEHDEITGLAFYDQTLDVGLTSPYMAVHYDFERITQLTGDSDSAVFSNGQRKSQRTNHCGILQDDCNIGILKMLTAGNPTPIPYDIQRASKVWSTNRHYTDIIRKKVVSGRRPTAAQTTEAMDNLTTYYGGTYHWDLALENDQNCMPCNKVLWGIDSKPFEFTWTINPDGSGQVNDLSPAGNGMEPFYAKFHNRRRVFKTYTFDTGFKTKIHGLNNGLVADGPALLRYFQQSPDFPTVNNDIIDSSDANEIYSQFQPIDKAVLFNQTDALCYAATITQFELVPRIGYTLSDTALRDAMVSEWIEIYAAGENGRQFMHPYKVTTIDSIEKAHYLFNGALTTEEDLHDNSGNAVNSDIGWPLVGSEAYENKSMALYQDRTKIAQLQPHLTFKVGNDSGFTWNSTTQNIQIDPQHFQSGTKFSNGGFKALATLTGSGTSLTTTIKPGQSNDPVIEPGDIFYRSELGHIHTVLSVNAAGITVTPAVEGNLSGDYKFYRYYNPFNGAQTNQSYKGYDAFGNNAYQETYVGPLAMNSDPDICLIPVAAEPVSITQTDATDPSNQDKVPTGPNGDHWRFFGRVTKTYQGTSFGQWIFTSSNGGNWIEDAAHLTGTLTTTEYNAADLPWLPTKTTNYLTPIHLTAFESLTDPSTHTTSSEDKVTEFYYYGSDDSAYVKKHNKTAIHGMPGQTRRYNGINSQDAVYQNQEYNRHGHVVRTWSANAVANSANYAVGTVYTVDACTGLINEEKSFAMKPYVSTGSTVNVWITGFPSTPPENRCRGRILYTYDALGRLQTKTSFDGIGASVGSITTTTYPNTFVKVVTETTPTTASDQLLKAWSFTDGWGRPVAARAQTGSESTIYESYTTYDAKGRLNRTYVSTEAGSELGMNRKGFSQRVYGDRGEEIGIRTYLSETQLHSSTWSKTTFLGADAGTLVQDVNLAIPETIGSTDWQSTNVTRLLVKEKVVDKFGRLIEVKDFELPISSQVWQGNQPNFDNIAANTDETAWGVSGTADTFLAYGHYRYDSRNNVVGVLTGRDQWNLVHGTGSLPDPHRAFRFDQFGRLRREQQPEIGSGDIPKVVLYNNYNHQDLPGSISCANRETKFTYNGEGNTLTTEVLENNAPVIVRQNLYAYAESGQGDRFPENLLESETYIYGTFANGYRHDYDPARGHLHKRYLLQGFDNALPAFHNANNPNKTDFYNGNLFMAVTLDDQSRPLTLTYPIPATATNYGLKNLVFDYDNGTGMLSAIREPNLAQGNGQVLFDQITYGPDNIIKKYNFLGLPQYNTSHELDALNRISTFDFDYGFDGGNQRTRNHTYEFGPQGMVKEILISDNRPGNSQPLQYGYDGLNRLVQATDTLATHTYNYGYDDRGNITDFDGVALTYHPVANQIDLGPNDGYSYTAAGELSVTPDAQMTYLPDGRMATYVQNSLWNAEYGYDAAGMRIYRREVRNGNETATLYFYDEKGSVLAEYDRQGWKTSHVYFADKTAVSFEREPTTTETTGNQGSRFVAKPVPTPITSGPVPVGGNLNWSNINGETYELEVATPATTAGATPQPLTLVTSLKKPSWSTNDLSGGDYCYRVRVKGGNWTAWTPVSLYTRIAHVSLDSQPFTESVADRRMFTRNGSLVPGKFGNAHMSGAFSGVKVYDDNGGMLPDGHHHHTLSFWVMPTQPDLGRTILATKGSGSFTHQIDLNTDGTLSVYGWPFGITWSNPKPLVAEKWHHIAITFGDDIRLYLDGEEIQRMSHPTGALRQMDQMELTEISMGNRLDLSDGFVGAFDDLRVFDQALTQAQIQALAAE